MGREFMVGAAIVCAIAGCSGGGNEPTQAPEAIAAQTQPDADAGFVCDHPIINDAATAVSAAMDSSCADCGLFDGQRAVDGDPSSFAIFHVELPQLGAKASMRTLPQPGVVYAAGTNPGVMAIFPEGSGSTLAVAKFLLRSYLNGVVQDQSDPVLGVSTRGVGADNQKTYYYLTTTKPYDSLEFEQQSENGTVTYTTQIFQICSDFSATHNSPGLP